MKFNMWQVLGAVLLVGGVVWFIVKESKPKPQPQPTPSGIVAPATGTAPASKPATQPK